MRITRNTLRRIIVEEAQKMSRKKRLTESQQMATEILSNAMEEYVDEMAKEGFGYEEACMKLKNEVDGFCEGFLADMGNEMDY